MIYATHRLYGCKHCVTTYKVVETNAGFVSRIYDFQCEKHSMQWYDAIILSSKEMKGSFFETFAEVLDYLYSNSDNEPVYAYGVTYDSDGCLLSVLR